MSDAINAQPEETVHEQAYKRAESEKRNHESEKRWFSFMKNDELAPEETREIAFLGYN